MAQPPEPQLDDDLGDTPDDRIVKQALRRFKRVEQYESTFRVRFTEDVKFVNGDSDNLYQWPDATLTARGYGANNTGDQRPCLTTNKTRQHCLQIINDARQNRTHIKCRPTGGGATFEAAQVYDGIIRHIEYVSNAQQAYATATRFQVWGGMGYIRLFTEYAGPDTFDQEIVIKRVKNPLSVYLDPDIQEADGSDARFGFVFEDMPKEQFREKYLGHKEIADVALDNEYEFVTADHVRVAEYFRRKEIKDQLVAFKDPAKPDGDPIIIKRSEMNRSQWRAIMAEILKDPDTQKRDVSDYEVEWFLIAGHEIIDRKPWPGRYIPIARVPGEETVIDGEMDRKGHVRALKDAQRMYNYNISAQVEFGALQNKIPYMISARAMEGFEGYWQTANTANYSALPYNDIDDEGRDIREPRRQEPPTASQAYQVALQTAANDMMLVSGQYQADFGAPSNERSGVAIQQRQRQGATATYHYIDHLAMALRFVGKMIIDLVPRVYDTKRVIKIMAEDGADSEVLLDPNAANAYLEQQQKNADEAKQVIFNPNVGRYEVISDVGPDFATRRQETFNALTQIVGGNQELFSLIGDLLFKSADFEYADEIAERLERLVPPQAKGDGPNPEVVKWQQIAQSQTQLMQAMSEKLTKAQMELQDKKARIAEGAEQKIIDVYDAQTRRLTAVKEWMAADPQAAALLVRQVILDAMDDPNMSQLISAQTGALAA